ncbi:MAG TPA: hypothetical protein VNM37_02020, partial [Candidatus Dormibacteraeota bacterium]|nr:hypothetical protein [Candidatus Dormibacteraeota bacterium]
MASGLAPSIRDHRPGCWAIGFVIATGLTGWMMEMLSVAEIPWSPQAVGWCWSPFVVLAVLRGKWVWVAGPPRVPQGRLRQAKRPLSWRAGMALLAIAAILACVRVQIPVSSRETWDGWAEFGFKAKAGFQVRGVPWAFLVAPQYDFSMPHYAIGLPSVQAGLALFSGGIDERLLLWLPLAHSIALIGLLGALLTEVGAGYWAPLFCGMFSLMPVFQRWAVSGYQDIPVAAAMTGALWLLLRASHGRIADWAVGLVAGTAGLIKNEGLVWGVGCLIVMASRCWTRRTSIGGFASALLIWAALVAPWRLETLRLHHVSKDYVIDPGRMTAGIPGRLPVVLRAVLYEGWEGGASEMALRSVDPGKPGQWWAHLSSTWNIFWYAAAAALAMGWRRLTRPPAPGILFLVLVMAMAYMSA